MMVPLGVMRRSTFQSAPSVSSYYFFRYLILFQPSTAFLVSRSGME